MPRCTTVRSRYADLVAALKAASGTPPRHEKLNPFVEKVKAHAYRVTDEDIDELLAAGLTQDEVFHATTHAALEAGLERFQAGLDALGDD